MDREQSFHEFERLFWHISRDVGYLWSDIYEQTFPGSQSHILFLLDRHGRTKMSELAKILHITPGAVTTASDRLIENGYIARIRDEEDRRVVHLDITKKGSHILDELQAKGKKIMKRVFTDISKQDLDIMNTIFQQASINIKKIGKENNE